MKAPHIAPTVQAMEDFLGGLNSLDSNPYTPDSFAAFLWKEAMQRLEHEQQQAPQETA